MEERLAWIKRQPESWAHWEPVRGGLQAHALLTRRYPQAGCFVTEALAANAKYAATAIAKPWWHSARWTAKPTRFEVPGEGAVQMLWANMALHMVADPQDLMAQWPVPVTELVLLGHSMGGLVGRSAVHVAQAAHLHWPSVLKHMVFLGTPHHGAPLERAGHWLDLILGATPWTAPLGNIPSSMAT